MFSCKIVLPMPTCVTCRKAPVRRNSTTCRACHAAYQKHYRTVVHDRNLARVRAAAEGMKRRIIDIFDAIGRGEMTGYTAASIVKQIETEVPAAAVTSAP